MPYNLIAIYECAIHSKYYKDDKIKEIKMDEKYNTHMRDENAYKNLGQKASSLI